MRKITPISQQFIFAPLSWAETANSTIEIKDVSGGTKDYISQKVTLVPEVGGPA